MDRSDDRHEQESVEELEEILKSLALYIGEFHWKQLTTPQRTKLAEITGYADPFA